MSKNVTVDVNFCGLLALLFIGLKLCHAISWSWWWVLSPLWLPVVFVLAIWFVVILLGELAQ